MTMLDSIIRKLSKPKKQKTRGEVIMKIKPQLPKKIHRAHKRK